MIGDRGSRRIGTFITLTALLMTVLLLSGVGLAAQQEKTITFWSAQTAILAVQDAIRSAAAKFEASRPGVKVNVELVAPGKSLPFNRHW